MLTSSDARQSLQRHRAYGLSPFIALLKEEGLDPSPLLKTNGISEKSLEDPDTTLSPGRELAFMDSALQQLGQPDLGLRCGPRYHLSFYGMLGLAAMASANLTEAYRVIFKYTPLTWTYMHWSLHTEGELAVITLEKHRDLGGCYQYMVDRGLTAAHTIACVALGYEMPLSEVNVRQRRPDYAAQYEAAFKCPVNFGAESNDLRFNESYLAEPLQQAETDSARLFAAQCEQICANLAEEGSFSEVIRLHLLQLPNQISSLESIAERLHMTARTIQRKLSDEGTSYLELVENVRRNLATEYLTTTDLTMEEIAVRIGYSDAPSFNHAFKRWTGLSPGKLRQKG